MEWLNFNKNDLFLNSDDAELAYYRRKDEDKRSVSWGQLKLLLALIQFITLFWDPKKVAKPKVVYAGAAPGNNIAIVSKFFPEVEFHLYDPAKFNIKTNDKIKLYQQYFTDEDAKKWAGRNDVYFISDIRSVSHEKIKDLDIYEAKIQEDMQNQMRWFQIINPVEGHLKLRFPYTGGSRPTEVNYLYGYVFKQPFAPVTSTETRMVPVRNEEGNWIVTTWSSQKYQDQLFYHNVVIREKKSYFNPLVLTQGDKDEEKEPIDYPELLNDWDSRAGTQILIDYLVKRTGKVDKESVISLSRLITKKLTEGSKHKDTLSLLRSQPQFIKKRNQRNTREDLEDLPTREEEQLKVEKIEKHQVKIMSDQPIDKKNQVKKLDKGNLMSKKDKVNLASQIGI